MQHMCPEFTIKFVVEKQVSTNLTGTRGVCICEELVYKDGTSAE